MALREIKARRASRLRVVKGAKMIRGETIVDCVIMDVSSTGARVRMLEPKDLVE